jgi:hypothetical protein
MYVTNLPQVRFIKFTPHSQIWHDFQVVCTYAVATGFKL